MNSIANQTSANVHAAPTTVADDISAMSHHLPDFLRLENRGNKLIITIRQVLLTLLLAAVVMWIVWACMFLFDGTSYMASYAALITGMAVVLWLKLRSTITIESGRVIMQHALFPLLERSYPIAEISQFYCARKFHDSSKYSPAHYTYTLKLLTKSQRRLTVVSGLRDFHLVRWLEGKIESHLGIQDQVVKWTLLEELQSKHFTAIFVLQVLPLCGAISLLLFLMSPSREIASKPAPSVAESSKAADIQAEVDATDFKPLDNNRTPSLGLRDTPP